jgi:hypothetical protein
MRREPGAAWPDSLTVGVIDGDSGSVYTPRGPGEPGGEVDDLLSRAMPVLAERLISCGRALRAVGIVASEDLFECLYIDADDGDGDAAMSRT